jgi:hypothetical protein
LNEGNYKEYKKFPTVNFIFFFARNFCGLPGKYLNLPVGLWQKVGKSNTRAGTLLELFDDINLVVLNA